MARTFSIVAALFWLSGCIYDADNRCGPHQHYGNGQCICDEGTRQNEFRDGCVPCGEHEVGVSTACVCEAGYSRASEGAACMPVSEALGRPCEAATGCSDETYSYCYGPSKGEPYCTLTGCTKTAECGGGFACDTKATPTVCTKLPTGLGTKCDSDSQCAGFEANDCETNVLNICMVSGCTSKDVTCFAGSVCCDYSALALPLSLCIPLENLDNGKCPLNGAIFSE